MSTLKDQKTHKINSYEFFDSKNNPYTCHTQNFCEIQSYFRKNSNFLDDTF